MVARLARMSFPYVPIGLRKLQHAIKAEDDESECLVLVGGCWFCWRFARASVVVGRVAWPVVRTSCSVSGKLCNQALPSGRPRFRLCTALSSTAPVCSEAILDMQVAHSAGSSGIPLQYVSHSCNIVGSPASSDELSSESHPGMRGERRQATSDRCAQ